MQATHNRPTTASTPDVEPTPADVLRGAARYLENHGWAKGDFFAAAPNTSLPFPAADVCGAICVAATGTVVAPSGMHGPDAHLALRAMAQLATYLEYDDINVDRPDIAYLIGDWNDDDNRGIDEVVDALDAAADDWEHQHPAVTP